MERRPHLTSKTAAMINDNISALVYGCTGVSTKSETQISLMFVTVALDGSLSTSPSRQHLSLPLYSETHETKSKQDKREGKVQEE